MVTVIGGEAATWQVGPNGGPPSPPYPFIIDSSNLFDHRIKVKMSEVILSLKHHGAKTLCLRRPSASHSPRKRKGVSLSFPHPGQILLFSIFINNRCLLNLQWLVSTLTRSWAVARLLPSGLFRSESHTRLSVYLHPLQLLHTSLEILWLIRLGPLRLGFSCPELVPDQARMCWFDFSSRDPHQSGIFVFSQPLKDFSVFLNQD